MVSHNHRLNSWKHCDGVASNDDFSINVYDMDRWRCSQWVPASEFDAQRVVVFAMEIGGTKKIAVARKSNKGGLYPGKHERYDGYPIVIARDENTLASGDQGDVLLVESDCLWTWALYTSSDNLPFGAVVAGYDVRKEPLYAARAEFDDIFTIGYYKSDTQLVIFCLEI